MNAKPALSLGPRWQQAVVVAIALLFVALSVIGITWGLPGRSIDKYLFGDDPPWPGEKIYRLAGAGDKFSPRRGADVDVDPIDRSIDEAVPLTATEADVAKILLRYRLYTYQPDEMITMMALAGMSPGRLDFDPRLYQYGGLFIYPVGALIKACGLLGLIDVRGDVVYYLDNPDEFGKFYVVARAYSAAWGIVGVLVVFAIARRLGGHGAGALAAMLFTLMPVVVCMAHEGKPHLPGAVLMLLAVLFAMRHLSNRAGLTSPAGASSERGDQDTAGALGPSEDPRGLQLGARNAQRMPAGWDWWLMCICCGASLGMVLSSLPIFILIPLVGWLTYHHRFSRPASSKLAADFSPRGSTDTVDPQSPTKIAPDSSGNAGTIPLRRIIGGLILAGCVYLVTNPYIVINAFVNRDVLRSNFGNSLAMYEAARFAEGFVRVVGLTTEGATLPILVLGVIALIAVVVRGNAAAIPLAVPAAVFFLQFVLIGAGKPGEYGRFGIFTNTALVIGTACILGRRWRRIPGVLQGTCIVGVGLWSATCGGLYLWNFHVDTTEDNSRLALSTYLGVSGEPPRPWAGGIAVHAEPAPYCFPPIPFAKAEVRLLPRRKQVPDYSSTIMVGAADRRDRSAANWFEAWRWYQVWDGDRQNARMKHWYYRRLCPAETPISWANKPFFAAGRGLQGAVQHER